MKKIKYAVFFMFILSFTAYSADFQFAIARFLINEDAVRSWIKKVDAPDEVMGFFLDFLEKSTTIKVDKQIKVVTFEKIEDIEKYPFIFMSSNGPLVFKDIEIKNMAEYCKRGGFIVIDDCVFEGKNSYFFESFRELAETKIFPGTKAKLLPLSHEIYHCHFDLTAGLPYLQGEPLGGWAISDDKGRLMIYMSPHDIHCGWNQNDIWTAKQKEDSLKMGVNIVIYAMTH